MQNTKLLVAIFAVLMFSIDVASVLGQNSGIQKRAQRPGGVTPGPKPVLAFASDRDSVRVLFQFDIYTMNADGSKITRLTNAPGYDNQPVWSRDGLKIAFWSSRDGNREIYTMNADGSSQTRLTFNTTIDGYPSWAPTGKKIAFERGRGTDAEVWVMSADGSGQTRLTSNAAFDGSPQFSPNGRQIAFVSDRNDPRGALFGRREIFVMNPDGSGVRQLTDRGRDRGSDRNPSWSPNGKRIAFSRVIGTLPPAGDGSADIYVMNADGTGVRPVIDSPPGVFYFGPTWSPDGKRIAFCRQSSLSSNADVDIVVVGVDGTGITPLTRPPARDCWVDWRP